MRQYTTPTITIRILKSDETVATDLFFDYLIFTLKHQGKRIDRRVEASEVVEGVFTIEYTQEETGQLPASGNVFAEINFFAGSKRLATKIKTLSIDGNLIDEVV